MEFSNEKRSFTTSDRTVLRLIEQAILHGLAPVVLPCTIQTVSDENGENRRDLSYKMEHSEDKSDLSNVSIYSIDSFPEDEISLTKGCMPSQNRDNRCLYVNGSLTIDMESKSELDDDMREFILGNIKDLLSSPSLSDSVPGLVRAHYIPPELDNDEVAVASGMDMKPKKEVPVRSIVTYSCIILAFFVLAAVAIFSQQYRATSSSTAKLASTEESTLPNSSLPPAPEDLEAFPQQHLARLNVWGYFQNNNKINDNLSVIFEGSNEDSSCVSSSALSSVLSSALSSTRSSTVGPYSGKKSPSVLSGASGTSNSATTEENLELLDVALSPKEENDLKKVNYSEEEINDLRMFRAELVRTSSGSSKESVQNMQGDKTNLSPVRSPSSPPKNKVNLIPFQEEHNSSLRPKTYGNNNSSVLPLSLHKMSQASAKNKDLKDSEII